MDREQKEDEGIKDYYERLFAAMKAAKENIEIAQKEGNLAKITELELRIKDL